MSGKCCFTCSKKGGVKNTKTGETLKTGILRYFFCRLCYSLASISSSSILIPASEILVPGPKMATTPASYKN